MAKEYSTTIAGVIDDFLKSEKWNYMFDEAKGQFVFNFHITSKIKRIRYIVDVHKDLYIVYGILPVGGNKDDRSMMTEMSEFLHRVNYGLFNGNFEFDFRDGEIRYKSFVDCADLIPSRMVVANSLILVKIMYDRYAKGMEQILFLDGTAEEAIHLCEG